MTINTIRNAGVTIFLMVIAFMLLALFLLPLCRLLLIAYNRRLRVASSQIGAR